MKLCVLTPKYGGMKRKDFRISGRILISRLEREEKLPSLLMLFAASTSWTSALNRAVGPDSILPVFLFNEPSAQSESSKKSSSDGHKDGRSTDSFTVSDDQEN